MRPNGLLLDITLLCRHRISPSPALRSVPSQREAVPSRMEKLPGNLEIRLHYPKCLKQAFGMRAEFVNQRMQKHMLAADCLLTTVNMAAQDNMQGSSSSVD